MASQLSVRFLSDKAHTFVFWPYAAQLGLFQQNNVHPDKCRHATLWLQENSSKSILCHVLRNVHRRTHVAQCNMLQKLATCYKTKKLKTYKYTRIMKRCARSMTCITYSTFLGARCGQCFVETEFLGSCVVPMKY